MTLSDILEQHAEHILHMLQRIVHPEEQLIGAANEQTKEIVEALEKYVEEKQEPEVVVEEVVKSKTKKPVK